MFPIRRLLGRRSDIGHVASGFRLGDGEARPFLARQKVREEALLQLGAAELDYRRDPKRETGVQRGSGAADASSGQLLRYRQWVRPLFTRDMTHLVTVNPGIHVIPLFHLDTQDIVDSQAFQPRDGQWRG